jgi:pimeloyl-ACP methyl ester carboxylesterase
MRATEYRAAGALAGDALAGTGAIARDVQRAAARRVFGLLGGVAAPVRVMHDGIATTVHACVRLGLRTIPRAAGHALALAGTETGLDDSPRGIAVLGALNGAYGDRLDEALALGLELRGDAAATGPVAVFVHGLGETDASWRLGGRRPYGARLQEELGITPLYARYNSGRAIADNGRALGLALAGLPAGEIVLVGHSMGGLVIRSAVHQGGAWTARVRHVVSLGTPHVGAPLARLDGAPLRRLPETEPFARLFELSAGIRDLRDGLDHPFHVGARSLGATVTRDRDHPVARVLGDLLVLVDSATGEDGVHLGSLNHFQLLNHPRVYAQLHEWLQSAAAARPPVRTAASGWPASRGEARSAG